MEHWYVHMPQHTGNGLILIESTIEAGSSVDYVLRSSAAYALLTRSPQPLTHTCTHTSELSKAILVSDHQKPTTRSSEAHIINRPLTRLESPSKIATQKVDIVLHSLRDFSASRVGKCNNIMPGARMRHR